MERLKNSLARPLQAEREKIFFLTSKVLPSNASFEGTIKSCRNSLKHLKTDYLDLYMLHWPSRSHPIYETMKAMEKLVRDNLIRFIEVSNFEIKEIQQDDIALQKERIACNQVLYHLSYRAIEKRIVPYCKGKKIVLLRYLEKINFCPKKSI